MNKDISGEINVCLLFGCSMCCNPVKISSKRIISSKDNLPFIELDGLLVLEAHPDTVRLKHYRCTKFNPVTGLCTDYQNRPNICRNTTCSVFDVKERADMQAIMNKINNERFIKICV